MKKTTILLYLLVSAVTAAAQNATVQVTNDYAAKIGDFDKHTVPMYVPDSLLNFEYKFDYSVFESPYKGAYEFSPYSVRITPQSRAVDGKRLYLRAGAGYSLHPELDFVFTPIRRERFNFSMFASGDGYVGKYAGIDGKLQPSGNMYNGRDVRERLGMDARWMFRNSNLLLEVGHDGIFSDEASYLTCYAKARIRSNVDDESFFFYDISGGYRYGIDKVRGGKTIPGHNLFLDGTVGPVLKTRYRFLLDFHAENEMTFSEVSGNVLVAGVTPRFVYMFGKLEVFVGANACYDGKFNFFPVAHLSYGVLGDKLTLYADLTAGSRINTYLDLKKRNSFYTDSYSAPMATREAFNAGAGLRGHAGVHFSYDLNGGYGHYYNNPFECVNPAEGLVTGDFYLLHADARLDWISDRVRVDAVFGYRRGTYDSGFKGYRIPSFSGDIAFEYNWNRRIYFGINARGVSSSRCISAGEDVTVPGWIDLGASLEYRHSRKWSFWVKCGNLLNNTVRTSLLHAWTGPYATAGVCLTL